MESVPSFQELDEDNLGDFDSRIERHIDLSGTNTTQRTEFEFILCSISITTGTFQDNWAFGAGLAAANGGAGGAIFATCCSLSIAYPEKNSEHFKRNKAAAGGAICALYSNFMSTNAEYVENEAWKYCGGVYLQGWEVEENGKIAVLYWQFKNNDFKGNIGGDMGGAVVATAGWSLYFETVIFDNNTVGISGGACYLVNNAVTKFFECDFIHNKAGNIDDRKFLKTKTGEKELLAYHIGGRGGGAIYFISDGHYRTGKRGSPSNKLRLMYTQYCCFSNNQVTSGTDFSATNSPGHNIMFNGFCQWHSSDDHVSEHKNSIAHVTSIWQSGQLLKQLFNTNNADENPCSAPIVNIISDGAVFEKKAASRSVDSQITSYVPSPSEYTYVATPITELPYATTKSWTQYSASTHFTIIDERTIKYTRIATLWNTPFNTLIKTQINTLWNTPFKTLIKTQINTLFNTLFNTPINTLFNTQFQTLINTLFNTPINTLFNTVKQTAGPSNAGTLFDTVWFTPFSTFGITPINTLFDTQFQTLINTLFDTPINTLFNTVKETVGPSHAGTLLDTLWFTPFSTFGITPIDTLFDTLYDTPFETLFNTPFETLFDTVKETLIDTLYDTPFETLFNTPFETLFDTPFETLDATMLATTILPTQTLQPGFSFTKTRTSTSTSYRTKTNFTIYIPTISQDEEGHNIPITIPVNTYDESIIYTVSQTDTEVQIDNKADGGEVDDGDNLVVIIAAAVSGVILIVIIALLVWFFVGYSKSSSSSDSVVEMDEETVLHVPDSTSAPITNDNPLWTTSVMGDTDDPFRNDFEEVAAEGFFNERAETVDSDP